MFRICKKLPPYSLGVIERSSYIVPKYSVNNPGFQTMYDGSRIGFKLAAHHIHQKIPYAHDAIVSLSAYAHLLDVETLHYIIVQGENDIVFENKKASTIHTQTFILDTVAVEKEAAEEQRLYEYYCQ